MEWGSSRRGPAPGKFSLIPRRFSQSMQDQQSKVPACRHYGGPPFHPAPIPLKASAGRQSRSACLPCLSSTHPPYPLPPTHPPTPPTKITNCQGLPAAAWMARPRLLCISAAVMSLTVFLAIHTDARQAKRLLFKMELPLHSLARMPSDATSATQASCRQLPEGAACPARQSVWSPVTSPHRFCLSASQAVSFSGHCQPGQPVFLPAPPRLRQPPARPARSGLPSFPLGFPLPAQSLPSLALPQAPRPLPAKGKVAASQTGPAAGHVAASAFLLTAMASLKNRDRSMPFSAPVTPPRRHAFSLPLPPSRARHAVKPPSSPHAAQRLPLRLAAVRQPNR